MVVVYIDHRLFRPFETFVDPCFRTPMSLFQLLFGFCYEGERKKKKKGGGWRGVLILTLYVSCLSVPPMLRESSTKCSL